MSLGSGWHGRYDRSSRRKDANAQSSAHFLQSRSHACKSDAVAFLSGQGLAGNADTIVRDDEMRGGFAEAKQQAHPRCMRMAMDVGQGFLGEPVDRRFGRLGHSSGMSSNVEAHFQPYAPAKSFHQRFHCMSESQLRQRRWMRDVGDRADLAMGLGQQALHFLDQDQGFRLG